VRTCAQGSPPAEIPAAVAAVLARYAPVAAVMGDFYRQFQQESRAASYPLEAIRQIRQQDIGRTPNPQPGSGVLPCAAEPA
jgi:hypothetical protein